MIQVVDTTVDESSHLAATLPADWFAVLSASLSQVWDIEREIDPDGEASVIVLPSAEDNALPTFMLFEKAGQAIVATIREEAWETERAFPTYVKAVDAILRSAECAIHAKTGTDWSPHRARGN